ncbi:hypothetical protein GCM10020000_49260 [Streptomyces olivoverticillatus]
MRQDVSLTEVKEKEKADQEKADAQQAALLKGARAEPAQVRVKVLNGSGRMGAAQETVAWMQNSQGMVRTSNGGNASGGKKDKTLLEFAPPTRPTRRASSPTPWACPPTRSSRARGPRRPPRR